MVLARSRDRIAHLQQTDPDACFVAEVDGEVVGDGDGAGARGHVVPVAADGRPGAPGQRASARRLLEQVLTTATDRSWIISTEDPAALRRYRRAGFDLHPAYQAKRSRSTARWSPRRPASARGRTTTTPTWSTG